MIRDLLNVIKQDENGHPLANNEEATEMPQDDPELTKFFSEIASLKQKLDELQKCISQARMKQSELLSAPRQEIRTKQDLDELTNQINRLAVGIRQQQKQIELGTQDLEARNETDPVVPIRKTQVNHICFVLRTAMNDFSDAQIAYRDACKAQLRRKMDIGGFTVTEEQLDDMLESDDARVFTHFSPKDTQQAKQDLADIEAQRIDIQNLEKKISSLHEVMAFLEGEVSAQGEFITSIQKNVDSTKNYVESANLDTKKAVIYQRSYKKKKWICCGVVVAILVIIAIALIASLVK